MKIGDCIDESDTKNLKLIHISYTKIDPPMKQIEACARETK